QPWVIPSVAAEWRSPASNSESCRTAISCSQMAVRTRPIVRLTRANRMVTKGYQKGVYEWVTKGISRLRLDPSGEKSAFHWRLSNDIVRPQSAKPVKGSIRIMLNRLDGMYTAIRVFVVLLGLASLCASVSAQNESVLYTFTGGADGGDPDNRLV